MIDFDPITQTNIQRWLRESYDIDTRNTIKEMLKGPPEEILDCFYTNLSFGTGGLRGIMGIGSNRMNIYTVGAAVQGLANYIKKIPSNSTLSILIGYDSRNNSLIFAKEAAKVLCGNGIRVYLFKQMCPSPLVSFGCRLKKCSAAIMITASHNSAEYNGMKFFWNDGAQLLPPHDLAVIQEVNLITDVEMIKKTDLTSCPLMHWIDDEINIAYIKAISPLKLYRLENESYGKQLKIVYTSLHGTGITVIPQTLHDWGFTNLHYVKDQNVPDGNFPTVSTPNPENESALQKGIKVLEEIKGNILLATDPDADRVGVAVLHQGKVTVLSGNQIASICLEHICNALTCSKKMPENAAFIKTIGTTELFQKIVDSYQKSCLNVLIGFKYIAEKIREWESSVPRNHHFIFGGEESFGYLYGTNTRDKDAIISSALICEVALHAKLQGQTMVDLLYDLYRKHGVFVEKLLMINFPDTKLGKEKIDSSIKNLQKTPPKEFNGIPVRIFEDYRNSIKINILTGEKTSISLPKSDILLFWLEDDTKLMIRPSGTECKIKIYCGIIDKNYCSVEEAIDKGNIKANTHMETLNKILLN
jgi:phosphomannomutase